MFKIGGEKSMYAKESIPLLRKVVQPEDWFQILFVSDLDKHKLGKTARVLAEYHAGHTVYPENLVSTTFTLAQEWTNQISQRVLVSAEVGMGAPPMGLFHPTRKNHFNHRDVSPFDFEVTLGEWHDLAQPGCFLPINCPFCPRFEAAERYRITNKDGRRIITPTCANHEKFAESRKYQ